jgi:hypothetical protein
MSVLNKIALHVEEQWGLWEQRPQMYFITKEALVCSLMVHIEMLEFCGLIKTQPGNLDYVSFYQTSGCAILGVEEKINKDNAKSIINHARELIRKYTVEDVCPPLLSEID